MCQLESMNCEENMRGERKERKGKRREEKEREGKRREVKGREGGYSFLAVQNYKPV